MRANICVGSPRLLGSITPGGCTELNVVVLTVVIYYNERFKSNQERDYTGQVLGKCSAGSKGNLQWTVT